MEKLNPQEEDLLNIIITELGEESPLLLEKTLHVPNLLFPLCSILIRQKFFANARKESNHEEVSCKKSIFIAKNQYNKSCYD